jgi:hypothetical protein
MLIWRQHIINLNAQTLRILLLISWSHNSILSAKMQHYQLHRLEMTAAIYCQADMKNSVKFRYPFNQSATERSNNSRNFNWETEFFINFWFEATLLELLEHLNQNPRRHL